MQEFRGKVAFWAVLISVIIAMIIQSWRTAGLLLVCMIICMCAYQLLGRLTRGALDPMNLKDQGTLPGRESQSEPLSQTQRERRKHLTRQLGTNEKKRYAESEKNHLELRQKRGERLK